MQQFSTLALAVVLVLGPACGDDGTTDGMDAVDAGPADASASCIEATMHSDLTWLKTNVFQRSCFFAMSCHNSSPTAEANLSLTPELAYAELVDVDSEQIITLKRVVPGDCANSYMFHKIVDGMTIPSNKDPMPPTFNGQGDWVPLCQQKIDAICRWIDEGALDN